MLCPQGSSWFSDHMLRHGATVLLMDADNFAKTEFGIHRHDPNKQPRQFRSNRGAGGNATSSDHGSKQTHGDITDRGIKHEAVNSRTYFPLDTHTYRTIHQNDEVGSCITPSRTGPVRRSRSHLQLYEEKRKSSDILLRKQKSCNSVVSRNSESKEARFTTPQPQRRRPSLEKRCANHTPLATKTLSKRTLARNALRQHSSTDGNCISSGTHNPSQNIQRKPRQQSEYICSSADGLLSADKEGAAWINQETRTRTRIQKRCTSLPAINVHTKVKPKLSPHTITGNVRRNDSIPGTEAGVPRTDGTREVMHVQEPAKRRQQRRASLPARLPSSLDLGSLSMFDTEPAYLRREGY